MRRVHRFSFDRTNRNVRTQYRTRTQNRHGLGGISRRQGSDTLYIVLEERKKRAGTAANDEHRCSSKRRQQREGEREGWHEKGRVDATYDPIRSNDAYSSPETKRRRMFSDARRVSPSLFSTESRKANGSSSIPSVNWSRAGGSIKRFIGRTKEPRRADRSLLLRQRSASWWKAWTSSRE